MKKEKNEVVVKKVPSGVDAVANIYKVLPEAIEAALVTGDLSKLSTEHRVVYYNKLCESVGLNPLTQPFEYMILKGKLKLYANKNCAEQLRDIHDISLKIVSKEKIENLYIVTVAASKPNGRVDDSTGVVDLGNLRGEELAHTLMKAETKAKRRATLSICGLGILDETEVQSIPGAVLVTAEHHPPTVSEPKGYIITTKCSFKGRELQKLSADEFQKLYQNLEHLNEKDKNAVYDFIAEMEPCEFIDCEEVNGELKTIKFDKKGQEQSEPQSIAS